VAVLSRDHAEGVTGAVDSALDQSVDARVLVLDRNSRPQTRAALSAIATRSPQVQLKLSDRDSGAAASLRLAAELAASEYVMFLGDRMRLAPGALAELVAVLDSDPSAAAVSSSGGWPEIDDQTVNFELSGPGADGPTGWVPLLGTLFRRSVLTDVPFASGLDLDCQNADWCLRIQQFAPGSLRVCPEPTLITPAEDSAPHGISLVERASATRALPSHVEFFALHDRLLETPLLNLVPELRDPSGRINTQAAKLLLGLVAERGPEWTLMEWMNGGLGPRLEWRPTDGEPELSEVQRERFEWLEARNERLTGIENGGWWKLREKVSPAIRLVRR
jgi:CTP:molybdopterin cytidylyltransferase MocA